MAVLMIFIIFRFKTHIKNAYQNYSLCNFMAELLSVNAYNLEYEKYSKLLLHLSIINKDKIQHYKPHIT